MPATRSGRSSFAPQRRRASRDCARAAGLSARGSSQRARNARGVGDGALGRWSSSRRSSSANTSRCSRTSNPTSSRCQQDRRRAPLLGLHVVDVLDQHQVAAELARGCAAARRVRRDGRGARRRRCGTARPSASSATVSVAGDWVESSSSRRVSRLVRRWRPRAGSASSPPSGTVKWTRATPSRSRTRSDASSRCSSTGVTARAPRRWNGMRPLGRPAKPEPLGRSSAASAGRRSASLVAGLDRRRLAPPTAAASASRNGKSRSLDANAATSLRRRRRPAPRARARWRGARSSSLSSARDRLANMRLAAPEAGTSLRSRPPAAASRQQLDQRAVARPRRAARCRSTGWRRRPARAAAADRRAARAGARPRRGRARAGAARRDRQR